MDYLKVLERPGVFDRWTETNDPEGMVYPVFGDDLVGMIRFGLFRRGPTEAATTASTTGSTPLFAVFKEMGCCTYVTDFQG